jgi:hypothetical protein
MADLKAWSIWVFTRSALLLSIALSEYKQVIFDILTPIVEGAKITLTPIKGNVKDK